MSKKEAQEFYPKSKKAWRDWLNINHVDQEAVWVIFFKKKTNKPSMTWSDAVDEALCFGWIDSTKRALDEERFIQYFCKRRPKSTWSKVNKEKVKILIDSGQMSPQGLAAINIAKENGSWEFLDDADNLVVPNDFQVILDANITVKKAYLALSSSRKKSILHRLLFAKREETRKKRITEIIAEINLAILSL